MESCPNCGSNDITGAFCDHCGTRVGSLVVEPVVEPPQVPHTPPSQEPSSFQPASPVTNGESYIDVPSHLAQSIILTFLCCMPAGIVAIVYSAGANTAKANGQYQLAVDKAKQARTWITAGWIIGVLWWIFVIVVGNM